jgi:AraC-like DNA-binding protein
VVNTGFKARLEAFDESYRFTLLAPEAKDVLLHEPIDCAFGTLVAMCGLSAGPGFAPLQIQMRRPAPTCPEKFAEFFACPVTFEAEINAVDFRKDDLDAALPTANSELARASDKIIQDYLARLESGDISRQIRSRLLNTLSAGELGEETVAHAMHMSVRTLQRKLREEGLTFKGLVDDMRRELAIEYVRDSRLTLGEITYLLGFSDPSNLTRAFRRWTGTTPNSFRMGH